MTVQWDCIVVGAGVVGCALAYRLASDGRKVLLIERDWSEPDRIVGELLQPGGIHALKKLDLLDCVEDIDGIVVKGYGVFSGNDAIQLPYPENPATGCLETGISFHHGRFVMKLRQKCLSHKNVTTHQATVTDLITDKDQVIGIRCTMKQDMEEKISVDFFAPLTFAVDGCFSKFRKEIRHRDVEIRSHFVGAILEDCPLPMPNHGHVILANPSPILLYQIGTHDTRILVDVPGKVPSAGNGDLKNYMLEFVKPQLPKSVQGPFVKAISEQRLRVMPNSFLPAVSNNRPGLLVLGDALNMRHPLTGGGMTVGLCDVVALTGYLDGKVVDLSDTAAVSTATSLFHGNRHEHCTVINTLAQALYSLFSAGDNQELKVLREACFAYFRLGGICIRHPISLLAGIIKSPFVLYSHFFAVATYGMIRLMSSPVDVLRALLLPEHLIKKTEVEDSFLAMIYRIMNFILSVVFVILSLPVNLVMAVRTLCTAVVVLQNS